MVAQVIVHLICCLKPTCSLNTSMVPHDINLALLYFILASLFLVKISTKDFKLCKLLCVNQESKQLDWSIGFCYCFQVTQPSPIVLVVPGMGQQSCHFVLGLSNWSLVILKIVTFTIFEAHNFVCRPLIQIRSNGKLYPSSDLSNNLKLTTFTRTHHNKFRLLVIEN